MKKIKGYFTLSNLTNRYVLNWSTGIHPLKCPLNKRSCSISYRIQEGGDCKYYKGSKVAEKQNLAGCTIVFIECDFQHTSVKYMENINEGS